MCILAALFIFGCENTTSRPPAPQTAVHEAPIPPPVAYWVPPANPRDVPAGTRPRLAVLAAPWCQWCMVLEAEVLPSNEVQSALAGHFDMAEVDIDRNPEWMTLPGVEGLPALVFFNSSGEHVLARSGFRGPAELAGLLDAVAIKLSRGEIGPYAPRPLSKLGEQPLSFADARATLEEFEQQLFMKVNGNDGGFHSPSRDPRPKLLWELKRWAELDAPARVSRWIDLTLKGANRGSSPAQRGEPLPDMDFSQDELASLSSNGAKTGQRWREGIETLPTKDAYLGLRDPIDGGFFRYAAGPGWYHPHFERFADQNLAWSLLLPAEDAAKTREYVDSTFVRADGWFNAAQASDPFYYRLAADHRSAAKPPPVSDNADLETQAWATYVDRSRCPALAAALPTGWPRARFADPHAALATPEAVGEVLVALSACSEDPSGLAAAAEAAWHKGLPQDARLHRLAAGLCAAGRPSCGAALSTVAHIRVDVAFAPPLVALARYTQRR